MAATSTPTSTNTSAFDFDGGAIVAEDSCMLRIDIAAIDGADGGFEPFSCGGREPEVRSGACCGPDD